MFKSSDCVAGPSGMNAMPGHQPISKRLSFAVSLAALAVSACNQPASSNQQNSADNGQPASAPPIAALPLATATPVAALPAPPASALPPPVRPLRYTGGARPDRYRYTERAYAMSSAFGDTPPDYTVDYQGTRPWIWRSNNGGYRVVEQVPGGQRDYYYQPGDTQPFYVSDPDGDYAYDRGELVGVYGADGVPVDDVYAARRADAAARYLYRAQQLYRAAQYQRRQAAYAADWQARRNAVIDQRQSWDAARARDVDWQSWHDAHAPDERNAWQAEQNRRVAYAAAIGIGVGAAAVALTRHHDGGPPNRGPANNGGRGMAGPPRSQNGGSFGQPANIRQASGANVYPAQSPQPHAAPAPKPQSIARPQPVAPVQPANVQTRHDQNALLQAQRGHEQQVAAARSAAENNARAQQAANSQRQAQAARQQQQVGAQRAAAAAATAQVARTQAAKAQAAAAQASQHQANAERQKQQQQRQQQQQVSRAAEQDANRARLQAEVEHRAAAQAQLAAAHQQQEVRHAQMAAAHQQQQAAHAAAAPHSAPAPKEQKPPRPHPEHPAN
jgi:hypothetical protein